MTCLYCYKESESDFHASCSKEMFGVPVPPLVPYTEADLMQLAVRMIKGKTTVTGIQPKLSMTIEKPENESEKLTIVGLWGQYILKPQSPVWGELPQLEDLTMHLAQQSKIRTAQHSLVRLGSGDLAYITKRMDRSKGVKLHMEDMCQLLGRLTEDKYKSSHEQIAKAIKLHSVNPGLDLVRFYEITVFCFLTGNADMHLKNFSLIKSSQGYELSPAYDLVSSALLVEGDDEELALTLCGKKKRLRKSDFLTAMHNSGMPEKVASNIMRKYLRLNANWLDFLDRSFLSRDMKNQYRRLITSKHKQLFT